MCSFKAHMVPYVHINVGYSYTKLPDKARTVFFLLQLFCFSGNLRSMLVPIFAIDSLKKQGTRLKKVVQISVIAQYSYSHV